MTESEHRRQPYRQSDEAVELVLRGHLPVPVPDSGDVLCMCDLTQTYVGPVGHRLHVAAMLREAGLVQVSAPEHDPAFSWRIIAAGPKRVARCSCRWEMTGYDVAALEKTVRGHMRVVHPLLPSSDRPTIASAPSGGAE